MNNYNKLFLSLIIILTPVIIYANDNESQEYLNDFYGYLGFSIPIGFIGYLMYIHRESPNSEKYSSKLNLIGFITMIIAFSPIIIFLFIFLFISLRILMFILIGLTILYLLFMLIISKIK